MMQKIKTGFLVIGLVTVFFLAYFGPVQAVPSDPGGGSTASKVSTKNDPCHPEKSGGTALTPAQLKSCNDCQSGAKSCLESNIIVTRLNQIINFLIGLVAIVVIGVIIVGGIQYTMSGGNPQKAADARKRITNALIAMFSFLLIWAFLQWALPGGI